MYLALESVAHDTDINFTPGQCLAVRVRSGQAIITLVGQHLKRSTVVERLAAFLNQRPAMILSQNGDSCSVRLVVPEGSLAAYIDILQRTFFTDVDPVFFASPERAEEEQQIQNSSRTYVARERQVFDMWTNRWPLRGIRS
jgi:hypothetical protein